MGNTKGMSRDICVILTQGAVSIKILDVVRRLNLRLALLSTLGTLGTLPGRFDHRNKMH